MCSLEDLNELDETLGVQLRLALASPLWKNLPYGVQINPRSWSIDILEVQPQRRLCAQILIPWRPSHHDCAPLHFIVLIWRNHQASCLHRLLLRLNERQISRGVSGTRPHRMLFYDALSHALIGQFRPGFKKEAPQGHEKFSHRWARRLFKALHHQLKLA